MCVKLCVGSIHIMDELHSILPLVLDEAFQKVFIVYFMRMCVSVLQH